MTLPITHENPLVLDHAADIFTQSLAFDQMGIPREEQPDATIIDAQGIGIKVLKVADIISSPEYGEVLFGEAKVVYYGEDRELCLNALERLIVSTPHPYTVQYQENAALLLADNEFVHPEVAKFFIDSTRRRLDASEIIDYDSYTNGLPAVKLDHHIENLPALTDSEHAHMAKVIAIHDAKYRAAESATGELPVVGDKELALSA